MSKLRIPEKQRLFWLWFAHVKSKLQEPILHFSAEQSLEKELRKLYTNYATADLTFISDYKLNIERIDLPASSMNTIICNHVLEHVAEKVALAELNRVLSHQGRLIVSVPIIEGWSRTYENPEISDTSLRELHFGQPDQLRYYGRDFRERVAEQGFQLIEEVTAEGEDVTEYGLLRGEKLFIYEKRSR